MKDLNNITFDIVTDGSHIAICQDGQPTGYYLALDRDRLELHSTKPSYSDGAYEMWAEP